MKIKFFKSSAKLRNWFEKNHEKEKELWLGYYKVGSGKPSVTWSQSVDEAICFGWIDGVRKSIDQYTYVIRFTPRKPTSIWSAVNIQKVEDLTKSGLMKPAGLAAFDKRTDAKSKIYAFEQKNITLDKSFEKIFQANKKAWKYFQSQAPWYQKTAIWRIMSARQEATKLSRLHQLIKDSESGQPVKELRRTVKSK